MVAELGYVCLTGGLGGVMEEAMRGSASLGGINVGLLPYGDHKAANPWCQIALPTGIGIARNALTARACDLMVALPGSRGTLQEMLFGEVFETRYEPVADDTLDVGTTAFDTRHFDLVGNHLIIGLSGAP